MFPWPKRNLKNLEGIVRVVLRMTSRWWICGAFLRKYSSVPRKEIWAELVVFEWVYAFKQGDTLDRCVFWDNSGEDLHPLLHFIFLHVDTTNFCKELSLFVIYNSSFPIQFTFPFPAVWDHGCHSQIQWAFFWSYFTLPLSRVGHCWPLLPS